MATTTEILEQEASSSVTRRSYDVFLSFRGPDTRFNFTDHLDRELVREGLRVFKDDDEIERGKAIDADSELEMAMRESKISVIVFSENYAYSTWCVDQLVRIMARYSSGHHVLPVFYHVDPSDVRNQRGSFEAAFVQHQERCKADRVDGWRRALKEVADLGGKNLNKGYESPFIQQTVQEVKSRVRSKCLDVTHIFVGREYDIRSINSWLREALDGVGVASISGMGGMGKTTIAKTVYNMNLDKFQGSSFLANVREKSKQTNGLVNLQRKLLSDILKQKANKIHSVDQGQMQINHALRCQTVLLVLDDVNHTDQIDNIIGTKAWFHPGSKLIITTRHEHLLRGDQVNKIFKIKELDFNESLQLFCWYAFGHEHPKHGYEKYSENVVHHCSGLPLALKVLGSSLSGKALDVWESKLQKLDTIPDGDVTGKLKISYDSLKDDLDKRLFLDIACFFIGVDLNIAFKVLDGCNLYPREGIGNLMDRFLVTTSAENKLMMHQLIRDMGREFVRRESQKDAGNYSRLWDNSDAILVLKENKGSESIRGLKLSTLMDDKTETSSNSSTNSTKRLRNEDYTGNLMTPNQRNSPKRRRLGFFSWKPAEYSPVNTFSTEALAKMQKLKLLVLYNVKFTGRYKDFPRSLVWLRWHGCSLSSIPEDCSLEKLVVLEMWNSKLKYVWKGNKLFEQLKILDLRHSHDLVRTPDFTKLPSLESLVLKGCIRLVQVDESIGYLTRLVSLNLKGCRSLKKLPVENNMLKSLIELNVSGCLQLEDLPQILMKNFESLSVLKANGTIIGNAREVSLSWWQSALWLWQLPRRQPQATGFSLECLPSSLVILALADSGLSDDVVPKDLNCFASLKKLDLSRNPITRLPESIKNLTMLECLSLCDCTQLRSVPQLPTSIFLDVAGCISLERIGNYPESVKSPIFRLTRCKKLVEVPFLFNLEPVGNIEKQVLRNLGLFNLESLESFELETYNIYTSSKTKTTTCQVLHECGIHSIFLQGSEVPSCFSSRNKGDSISFDVPPGLGCRCTDFSLCVINCLKEQVISEVDDYRIDVDNKTMGLKLKYEPAIRVIRRDSSDEDLLWLSSWKLGDQMKLREGDQVRVSVYMRGYDIKECSVKLIYEEEGEVQVRSSSHYWSSRPSFQVSPYHREIPTYFLNNRPVIVDFDHSIVLPNITFQGSYFS